MANGSDRLLMVANPGGHLQQLRLLDERLPFDAARLWVTADTPQSRSLLEGADVEFVPDVGSRQVGPMIRNIPRAVRLLRKHNVVAAVSTGSGLALSFLPVAAARGVSTHYIESATRTKGPSLTGKLLRLIPRVAVYSQHEAWADDHWSYPGSVFDGFELAPAAEPKPIRKVVVSLGTSRLYGFRRLVERLLSIIPSDAEVLWQTGCTDVAGLRVEGRDLVPGAELEKAIGAADVLIAHAGTGIALAAFEAGQSPVLVPREHRFGEHVDDHQLQTAELLDASGLAIVRRVEALDLDSLKIAAASRVIRRDDARSQLRLSL